MKKTLKRMISLVLMVSICLALIPAASAFQEGEEGEAVKEVRLYLTPPVVGRKLGFSGLYIPEGYHCSRSCWFYWKDIETQKLMKDTEVSVEEGDSFEIAVTLKPQAGYKFTKNTKVYLNGTRISNGYTVQTDDKNELRPCKDLSGQPIVFTACEGIEEAEVKLELPVPGQKPVTPVQLMTVPADGAGKAKVIWLKGEDYGTAVRMKDETFETGKTYWAVFDLCPADGYSFTNGTVILNGERIDEPAHVRGGNLMFVKQYDMGVKKARACIDHADVSLTYPLAGKKIRPATCSNPNLQVEAVWTPGDEVFREGAEYQVQIQLKAKDGYALSKDISVDILVKLDRFYTEIRELSADRTTAICEPLNFGAALKPVPLLEATITEPVIGAVPSNQAKAPDDAEYIITGMHWCEEEKFRPLKPEETFQAGKTYVAMVSFAAKPGYSLCDIPDIMVNGRFTTGVGCSGAVPDVTLTGMMTYPGLGDKPFGIPFTDVAKDQWYYPYIDLVYSLKVMNGHTPTTFGPEENLSRAQLTQILMNYYNESRPMRSKSRVSFTDVPASAWYYEAVTWAAECGYVGGYGGGLFGPEDPITREQLATILWRALREPAASETLEDFTDRDQIDDYAETALAWAVENEIMGGKGNGILDPLGNATRAEAAKMVIRFITYIRDNGIR